MKLKKGDWVRYFNAGKNWKYCRVMAITGFQNKEIWGFWDEDIPEANKEYNLLIPKKISKKSKK